MKFSIESGWNEAGKGVPLHLGCVHVQSVRCVKGCLADVAVVGWRLGSLRSRRNCLGFLQDAVKINENVGVQRHISGCFCDGS